jgi:acetyl-CoA carboxylase biotin carboxyl carrier protein
MLSYKEIKELIDLACERGLSALEIEQAGFRVRIEAALRGNGVVASPAGAPLLVSGLSPVPTVPSMAPGESVAEEGLHVITSPIVGTFYRSASPEANPFAEVGQRVSRGKILCIIESMKLMNEIESDVEGEIIEVYPRNGQPVEYGEKLFAIRLAA